MAACQRSCRVPLAGDALASLHPEHGARVVLLREAMDGEGARYRITIYEPEAKAHVGAARLTVSGEVAIDRWPELTPTWMTAFVDRLLRGLPKKHADGSWPRKITRWREGAAG